MADSTADKPGPEESAGKERPSAPDDLASLRCLLVGPEQDQLRALQSRLDDPKTQAREVSRVLPEAIALRGNDGVLTKALSPSVELAINTSVRRNPKPLADALFPVMGPAIRKAISHALGTMLESFNKALEQSLSLKSLQWRVEAWRTGKSFSEVVLVHTLLYRVEQVLLIQRSSGLLLQHVTRSEVVHDPDMVSSMMTVMRDFARDSVNALDQEALEELKIGELFVWAEQGPHAILVALVRGHAPKEFLLSLQDALESIHLQFPEELESLGGDERTFESARPILEACLETRYRQETRAARFRGGRIFAAVVILSVGIWGFFYVRDRIRWSRYLSRIRSEPGIVVISTSSRWGGHAVTGLRDPLSPDPDSFVAASGLSPGEVSGRWQPYQALDPRLILLRAQQILDPPPSVTLSFDNGELTASGSASPQWIGESRKLARVIPGVMRYQERGLEEAGLRTLREEIERTNLQFIKGTSRLLPGQQQTVSGLLERISRLDSLAQAGGRSIRVQIIGHTDSDGNPEMNEALSNARAEAVRSLLRVPDLTSVEIAATGVGSAEPLIAGTSEKAKQQNRRVSFRLTGADAQGGRSSSKGR